MHVLTLLLPFVNQFLTRLQKMANTEARELALAKADSLVCTECRVEVWGMRLFLSVGSREVDRVVYDRAATLPFVFA